MKNQGKYMTITWIRPKRQIATLNNTCKYLTELFAAFSVAEYFDVPKPNQAAGCILRKLRAADSELVLLE